MNKAIDIIKKKIIDILPNGWEKVDVFVNVTETNYEFSFYVYITDKKYQCYELEKAFGIQEEKVNSVFEQTFYELKKS